MGDDTPSVSGDRLAWAGFDGTDFEIYTWAAGDAAPTVISDNTTFDSAPVVSGDRVVWENEGSTVYLWEAGDGAATAISGGAGSIGNDSPDISGDRVVWRAFDGVDHEIYTWKVGDAAPTAVTTNDVVDRAPQVSGNRVVWQQFVWPDYDVYTWAEGDALPTAVTDNDTADEFPQISGDRVVWDGDDGTDREVYLWVVGDAAPTALATNTIADDSPAISGERVAWQGNDGTDAEIYTLAFGDATAQRVTDNTTYDSPPVVSGDRLAWWGESEAGLSVYTWKGGDSAPTVLAQTLGDMPTIGVSGDRVVWSASDGEDGEIYMAAPGNPELAPNVTVPVLVEFGSVTVGSVTSRVVTIGNTGSAPLTVSGIALEPADQALVLEGLPELPTQVAPGASLQVELRYQPAGAASLSGVLEVTTDDPDSAVMRVGLSGVGVAPATGAEQQVADLLTFFDESQADGMLWGVGRGRSAVSKACAFRDKLVEVRDLVASGNTAGARSVLRVVARESDGERRPPDLIDGRRRVLTELRADIAELTTTLGGHVWRSHARRAC